jgi:hypothetical protein
MILKWKRRTRKVSVKGSCPLVCVLECKVRRCVGEPPMERLMRIEIQRQVDRVPLRKHQMARMYQKVAA